VTTGDGRDRLKQKALMYVFGKHVESIVNVIEGTDTYTVRYEEPKYSGVYHLKPFSKDPTLEHTINDALKQLNWISEGNEFPT